MYFTLIKSTDCSFRVLTITVVLLFYKVLYIHPLKLVKTFRKPVENIKIVVFFSPYWVNIYGGTEIIKFRDKLTNVSK